MKTVILETVEDRNGTLGLIVEGMKLIDTPMAALEGRMIAHDIIEHINGIEAIGSIDDELEALGAIWFVRGQYNDMNRDPRFDNDAYEGLARDIQNLGDYFMQGINFREDIPPIEETNWDEDFEGMIERGKELLIQESECRLEVDEEVDMERVNDYIQGCMPFMQRGYHKAKKKYENAGVANSMFWNIADAVDKITDMVEFEGMRFELNYSKDRAFCEEYYEEH